MSSTPPPRTSSTLLYRLSERLTSRLGARVAAALGLGVLLVLIGLLSGAGTPPRGDAVSADAESARVAAQVAEEFPATPDTVLVVAHVGDDQRREVVEGIRAAAEQADLRSGQASTSQDTEASVVPVVLPEGEDPAGPVDDLRAALAEHVDVPVHVTGGAAFGVDIAQSFDGADLTLLLVTVAVVGLLLILTYRSPVLWLLPLLVIGLADQTARLLTAAAGTAWGWSFDGGIIGVLVFGAGANYSMLLISRYREELRTTADHRAALARAWRHTVPAVVASNLTVVLALGTLVLTTVPGTRGLGLAAALGLLVAAAAVLLVLPPLLALAGRRGFWPSVPQISDRPVDLARDSWWGRLATRVLRRPGAAVLVGSILLAVMATGLLGTSVGLAQADRFRVASDSDAGLTLLADHFGPGQANDVQLLAPTDRAEQVAQRAEGVEGVLGLRPAGTSAEGDLTRWSVQVQPGPGTQASEDLVRDLRAEVAGTGALVGGTGAEDVDALDANRHDLLVAAPLVLLVSLLVLVGLLRSLVAPLILLVANLASAVAAIGAGSFLARVVFDQPALDVQVPLLAFLFLVALGIDYSIFLAHRARTESASAGTALGIRRAVGATGGVITSAGVVLAAVFAALGVLPLVTLGQLGLIVGLGVLVDTLVVRVLLLPAVFSLVGDRVWWPSRPVDRPAADQEAQTAQSGRDLDRAGA